MVVRQKDYAVSFARLIAMVCVVTGHFAQYYGSVLAWVLNFCVKMFLFISGYLYSEKEISNCLTFYGKTARKLLPDYYIYALAFIALTALPGGVAPDASVVFNLLIIKEFPPEVGQFWFIPYILLCYALLPLFQKVLDEIDRHSGAAYLLRCAGLFCVVEILIRNFFPYFLPVWIDSFLMGMLVCRCRKKQPALCRGLVGSMGVLCPVTVVLLVWLSITHLNSFSPAQFSLYVELFHYSHMLLGICVVLFIIRIFPPFDRLPSALTSVLDWSDKYSYDIYIVHNLFIQGTYSVLNLVQSRAAGIFLACLLTLISGLLLNRISGACRKKLFPQKISA